jgi:hypothetical protein
VSRPKAIIIEHMFLLEKKNAFFLETQKYSVSLLYIDPAKRGK